MDVVVISIFVMKSLNELDLEKMWIVFGQVVTLISGVQKSLLWSCMTGPMQIQV